jgi:hypothetical protein
MALPHEFTRIRLNLARKKEFPRGSAQHGTNSSLRSTRKDISTRKSGETIASIAGSADSGRAKTMRLARSSISRAVKSTPAGCLTTIATGWMTTKLDTASEHMFLPPANM